LAYGNALAVDKLLDGLLRVEQGPDHPPAGGGPVVESGERLELLLAADQRRQTALPRHLQPGLAADLTAHGVGTHRLLLPLQLELAQLLEDEKPCTQPLGAPAHNDLARL